MTYRASKQFRAFVAALGIGALVSTIALLLSDRAPRLLRLMFGDLVERISRRLDAGGRAGAALQARDVGSDSIVHFGLWALAMVLVGIAVWSWIGLAVSGLVLASGSLLTEVAQGRYSSRSVEQSDAMFNLLGIAAGGVIVAAIYVIADAVASRRPSDRSQVSMSAARLRASAVRRRR